MSQAGLRGIDSRTSTSTWRAISTSADSSVSPRTSRRDRGTGQGEPQRSGRVRGADPELHRAVVKTSPVGNIIAAPVKVTTDLV